ncbi:essential nuclear protein 1 [Strigomonas culicis]|nr:essential nuclear protein 1 [Strigomonas culicis]|eukprot:EPY31543.1 essential nuclear protein 1 [Strigomonas culicis]
MPPKAKRTRPDDRRNDKKALDDAINTDRFASSRRVEAEDEEGDLGTGGFVLPQKATQRILRTAREQLDAVQAADDALYAEEDGEEAEAQIEDTLEGAPQHSGGFYQEVEDDDGELVELEYDDTESIASEMPLDAAEMAATDLYDIDEEEARLLQKFQPTSRLQSRNLAEVISEKIKEKEGHLRTEQRAAARQAHEGDAEDEEEGIDPRVARVYTAIGTVLKRYTSGKIPKAFKILPNVRDWERLIMLTKPDQWSPHATYQATRIFAANLNERMAQRYYASILLPIVHERFTEDKRLHPSLYMAVRKALFKPIAFFKGFLLPLASDEECTLKEALVVASVLQRCHLPPVPTAVTIVKLAQMPFSGPCSVLLRVLIDKKMALPLQAIDALVAYFHRFIKTHRKDEPLPVLWHQTLLSFCQRYKNDLTEVQVDLLLQVCSYHFHYMITPETRRELSAAARSRPSE